MRAPGGTQVVRTWPFPSAGEDGGFDVCSEKPGSATFKRYRERSQSYLNITYSQQIPAFTVKLEPQVSEELRSAASQTDLSERDDGRGTRALTQEDSGCERPVV